MKTIPGGSTLPWHNWADQAGHGVIPPPRQGPHNGRLTGRGEWGRERGRHPTDLPSRPFHRGGKPRIMAIVREVRCEGMARKVGSGGSEFPQQGCCCHHLVGGRLP